MDATTTTASVSKSFATSLEVSWEFPTSLVTNASAEDEAKKIYVSNEIFSMGKGSEKESSWKALMNPCYIENGVRYISMHIRLVDLKTSDENSKYVDTMFHIGLRHPLGRANEELLTREDTFIRRMTLENNTFGWDKFMKYDELGPNPHSSMTFIIQLTTTTDPVPSSAAEINPAELFASRTAQPRKCKQTSKNEAQKSKKQLEELQTPDELTGKEFMARMALKMKWSRRDENGMEDADCLLHTENQSFPAHSLALKINSPKITKTIKEAGLIPSKDNPHHFFLLEWSSECIEGLLEYCYTGDIKRWIPEELETLAQLAELGAYYEIEGLVNLCRELAMIRTDVENYMEVFVHIIRMNMALVPILKDNETKLKEKLEDYRKSDFLTELLNLRSKYPSVLSDYKGNISEYSTLIFDLPVDDDEDFDCDVDTDLLLDFDCDVDTDLLFDFDVPM